MRIHPSFKLNGKSYSNTTLAEVASKLLLEKETFKIAIGNFILEWLKPFEQIAVSTSGSTGKPKQILLKKQQMVNSALTTGFFFRLKASDSALLCLPCDFIAGKMMLVRAMVLGLEIDCVAPSSTPLIDTQKAYHFAAMIPLQAENSIEKLELIKTLLIGGASINKILENKLVGLTNSIFETYGMTETITHIAVRKLTDSHFKTLPDISINTDKRDCLVINASKICDDEVITNDIVELISTKEFKWLGRYDSIINSGGVKLIPEQIEAKLSRVIKNRFFVSSLPDYDLGNKLIIIVEGAKNLAVLDTCLLYTSPSPRDRG